MRQEEPDRASYRALIELARREDLGQGDVSSEVTIDPAATGTGCLVYREPAVVCGLGVAQEVLRCYDERLRWRAVAADGDVVSAGRSVGEVAGPLRSLLAAERVVLNFMQRLSGIATTTAAYVKAAAGLGVEICDTRKTTPGWRTLEKYAVRCGGGCNHRQGLYDAVLIKDNHLKSLGHGNLRVGLETALARLAQRAQKVAFVEVEVDTLEQLQVVLGVEGVDMVLLDNMSVGELAEAVKIRDAHDSGRPVRLEASGNVTLATVRAVAESGVDRISVGALTHSVRSVDIGLDMR